MKWEKMNRKVEAEVIEVKQDPSILIIEHISNFIFLITQLNLSFFCLFCCFTSQVNSYGHYGTVSSPNHTFFLGKLEQAVN